MIFMSWIESLVLVLGAVGGLEFIKWLFTRKSSGRVAEAKADTDEFRYLRERIEFADKQLLDKEQRFKEQTDMVRDLNRQLLEKQTQIGDLQSQVSELLAERKMKLCERRGCQDRQPQSNY